MSGLCLATLQIDLAGQRQGGYSPPALDAPMPVEVGVSGGRALHRLLEGACWRRQQG